MLTTYSDHYALMGLSRFFSGAAQIVITLYIPLYIDAFIERDQKAYYMPFSTLSAIIGTIIGYSLTSVILNMKGGNWQLSINTLVLVCFICSILTLFIPAKYLDLNAVQGIKNQIVQEYSPLRKQEQNDDFEIEIEYEITKK